ncbi:MAG: DUF2059 domain-containing protein [Pseudomonadales bacterium]
MSPAFAAESGQERLAEELLDLTHMDVSVNRMARQMSELMVSQLAQLPVARQHHAQSIPYLERVRLLILATMTWESLREDYVTAYTETFTEAEFVSLVGFFGTDEGRSYIGELQNLQQRALEINERHARRIAPAVRAIANEMQTELESD